MGFSQVEVVARTVKVGRHRREKPSAVLSDVGLAHFDQGDLSHGIGIVGQFQGAGEKVFLLERLGRRIVINAGAPQEEKPFNPGQVRVTEDVVLDHQVVMDKLGQQGVVGMDAAHLGRNKDYILLLFRREEAGHCTLIGQIQFVDLGSEKAGVHTPQEAPHQGRADESP